MLAYKTEKSPGPGSAFPLLVFDDLREKIDAAAAVSFDFFDTLFVRTLLAPEDVFDIVGRKFGIKNFRELRQKAQADAFRRMRQARMKEITLDNIYACLDRLGNFPVEEMKRAEYEAELSVLHPNKELEQIFNNALDSGKPVVVTSDMYLPAAFFEEAFRLNRMPPVPFFISADRNATKRDAGELFDIVASCLALPHGQILHIGDNPQSDITQAQSKGLETFHYVEQRRPSGPSQITPEASLASGLLRRHKDEIPEHSFRELGFLYGGPAAVGFLEWISSQAEKDKIDHVLFLARDGYALNAVAQQRADINLPRPAYFLGSRTVFTLASITEANFSDFIPFLLSGADGLSPHELLERIGVAPPAEGVMADLELGPDVRAHPGNFDRLRLFLYAYRWEILKVCRRNRRALFRYLQQLGIKDGDRVALVDIGWNGTAQNAFEEAISSFLKVEVFGYYFCLANSKERRERQRRRRMAALVSSEAESSRLVDAIFENRVLIELFFSAPHGSVIGLNTSIGGNVLAVEDDRNSAAAAMADVSREILQGAELFGYSYGKAIEELGMPVQHVKMAMPLIDFAVNHKWKDNELLNSLGNFDDWSYSRNRNVRLSDY